MRERTFGDSRLYHSGICHARYARIGFLNAASSAGSPSWANCAAPGIHQSRRTRPRTRHQHHCREGTVADRRDWRGHRVAQGRRNHLPRADGTNGSRPRRASADRPRAFRGVRALGRSAAVQRRGVESQGGFGQLPSPGSAVDPGSSAAAFPANAGRVRGALFNRGSVRQQ